MKPQSNYQRYNHGSAIAQLLNHGEPTDYHIKHARNAKSKNEQENRSAFMNYGNMQMQNVQSQDHINPKNMIGVSQSLNVLPQQQIQNRAYRNSVNDRQVDTGDYLQPAVIKAPQSQQHVRILESPRSKKRRERIDRQMKEKQEMEANLKYDPFGRDKQKFYSGVPNTSVPTPSLSNQRMNQVEQLQNQFEQDLSVPQSVTPTYKRPSKITKQGDQELTDAEIEKRYNQKMSYAEELQMQVLQKKKKDQEAKRKVEQEDLLREQKIQEEIKREQEIVQLKKSEGGKQMGAGVRFSPQVNKRSHKQSPSYKAELIQQQMSPPKQLQNQKYQTHQSPMKKHSPQKTDPSAQVLLNQQRQIEMQRQDQREYRERVNQQMDSQFRDQLDRLQRDMVNYKARFEQELAEMRQESLQNMQSFNSKQHQGTSPFEKLFFNPIQAPAVQNHQQSNPYSNQNYIQQSQNQLLGLERVQNNQNYGSLMTDSKFLPIHNRAEDKFRNGQYIPNAYQNDGRIAGIDTELTDIHY